MNAEAHELRLSATNTIYFRSTSTQFSVSLRPPDPSHLHQQRTFPLPLHNPSHHRRGRPEETPALERLLTDGLVLRVDSELLARSAADSGEGAVG